MGREGFEPSTLGLRVRSDRTQRVATRCKELHLDLQRAATNYAKSGNVETNLYAQAYAHFAAPADHSHRPRGGSANPFAVSLGFERRSATSNPPRTDSPSECVQGTAQVRRWRNA